MNALGDEIEDVAYLVLKRSGWRHSTSYVEVEVEIGEDKRGVSWS